MLMYMYTEEEHEELLKKRDEDLTTLRETNMTLKKKLDGLNKADTNVNINIDAPFIVRNETLAFNQVSDFIQYYNSFSTARLLDMDKLVFEAFTKLAKTFVVLPQFKTQSDLKRYRVNLQKKKLYEPLRINGVYTLKRAM